MEKKEAMKILKDFHDKSALFSVRTALDTIIPELRESNDEKIRQKFIKLVKMSNEVGGFALHKWEADEMLAWLEKQGKQKPADKVEPKFHEGEWIVWKDKCYKVNYNGCGYELVDQNGLSTSLEYGTVDTSARLWNITKDVKDGDVLYSLDTYQPFIYKARNIHEQATAYCGINKYGKFFVWNTNDCIITLDKYIPATKEQRDTLLKAMADAGYTFDFGKKELKKIEKKSQRMVSAEAKEALYDKPAWSEEDDNCLSTIIAEFSKCSGKSVSKDEWMRCNDFLNSLKGRVQPQKQWKPSAGQMKALHDLNLAGNISYAGQGQTLIELYNDLKKLKGE